MKVKNSPIKTKLTKVQYQAILQRVMDRQSNPVMQQSVLGQMQGPGMQVPQGLAGTPMGMQPTQPPQQDLMQQLQQSQGMWQNMQGGPGEELWNMLHQDSPRAQQSGASPEEHFHNLATMMMSDPSQVPEGDDKNFIDMMLQHQNSMTEDPAQLEIKEALANGWTR